MTKKKRELIEILLDNVKPEDWPEIFPYAAQDKSCSMVYVYANIPYISSIYGDRWECGEFSFNGINIQVELCKFWNKTIVHRDEFMKRWNERNPVDDSEGWVQWNGGEMPVEKGTLIDKSELLREPMPQCREEIPCRFVDEKSPLETQIGGVHYTKLAIQPMQYSMKNGLDPLQHTVIKYVTRFRDKAGIEDLEKAKHCIDMLIEYEKENK